MRHESNVGLVDPHAERDRRDHDHSVFAQEARLVGRPQSRVETRVVRQRGDAIPREELGGLLDGCPRQAVDDARLARVFGAQQLEELLLRRVLWRDAVLDVRPVKTRDEMPRIRQLQALLDLEMRLLGRRRGECDARHCRPTLVQHGELQVVGTEVVAPLRNTVCLVDRKERDRSAVEQVGGRRYAQPLRREIEQVEIAREEGAFDTHPLGGVLGGVEKRRPNTDG